MNASVLKLRPVTNRGNLRALADVEISFEIGASIIFRGCRVIQQDGQRPYVALPQVEAADGKFFPAVSAPDLREAIQPLVLAEWQKQSAKAR